MRSINLSVVVGITSLILLGTAASKAEAQRIRVPPTMPRPAAVMSNNMIRPGVARTTFVPGILPTTSVEPITTFPFNPRTGTFSAVGLSSTLRLPTYASTFPTYGANYNAFLNAGRLTSFYETYYHVNPFALSYANAYYNTLLSSNPYVNPYSMYYTPYYNPYMMSYGSGYGGYGGGGYGGGGYGGYSSPYMNANMMSPYASGYTTTVYPTSLPSNGPAVSNQIAEVGIYDDRYEPATINVPVGATVRWTNYGNHKHSVTSDSGLWDSQGLAPAATTSYTFTQPGKYTYHCSLHSDMRGTVIVK